MANIYDIGDKVRISCAFTSAGVATDPTAIVCKVKKPDGTITTATYALSQVSKASTGNYYYDFTIDQVGSHWYRFAGTGTVVAAAEGEFLVRKSEF
jgi:hypothetical protein